MGIPSITIDTHALIWYIDTDFNKRLSESALQAIKEAEERGTIYIPIIVIMESLDLIEKKRVNLTFSGLMSVIDKNLAYEIVSLDRAIIEASLSLKGLEIHDRLIVATALVNNTALVCRDLAIKASGIKIIW